MDAADELRAALERRDAEDRAEDRRREELDRRRREFEREEARVKQQLHEAVDVAVQAIGGARLPPANLPITPPPESGGLGRLFERQQLALGWKIRWRGWERVLCPDGTLITPGPRRGGPTTSTLGETLHNWVDRHLERVRRDSTPGIDTETDLFAEAFGSASFQGQERKRQEIHERLSAAQASFMRDLADLLRQLDISTV